MKLMKRNPGEDSVRQLVSNIVYCIVFLHRANKLMYFVRIPYIIFECLSNFIPIIFVRFILNEIAYDKNIKMLIVWILFLVGSTFIVNILRSILSKIDAKQVDKAMYSIRSNLGDSVMKMQYCNLENPQMKDFINRAINTNSFFDILTQLTASFQALLNVIGLLAIISTISPVMLLFVVLVVIVKIITDRRMRRTHQKMREYMSTFYRKHDYLYSLGVNTEFGKEIRINKLEKWIYDKFSKLYMNHVVPIIAKRHQEKINYSIFVDITLLIQTAAIYLYLGFKVVFQKMLVGDFSMYLTSIEKFSDYVEGLIGNFLNLLSAGLFAKEFRYCMEFVEKFSKHNMATLTNNVQNDDFVIEFKNVSFTYPDTENEILKNLSITISSNESLSIVGINGAGKTTFVKLLCRFYNPTKGEILFNGIPIQDIPYETYIRLISVVFQDFKLFAFSVEDNISMSMTPDKKRMKESIKNSGLTERILSLPMGLDTMMTKEFDSEGIELSGGEAQKLAIARAIYKGSPLVILDEPTSALDPIAEYDIYNHFSILSKGKCTIYISHRLSSTRFTDKIAVFSNGTIVEYGNHKDLMRLKNGIYRNMFETQAQYYR